MKMVNSLLLATAAGLVAVSGAQAADLPVKAKPVEYVKICSLYGAGFYYIPGTDICMKVGGYIRFQQNFNSTDITRGPFGGTGARNTRLDSSDYGYRSRAIATFDTRQQTPYGTLRTYLILGATSDSSGGSTNNTAGLYANRAFIQIAGFTFGKASSYFDFVSSAAVAYNAGNTFTPDTGDGGAIVAAYTAQFGNGVSATISAEQARRSNLGTEYYGPLGATAATANNLMGTGFGQDIVGNIRIDQAWGSAQVSAALHDVSAGYYGTVESAGHPGSKWGWAVSGGLRLNAPMIGPGDYFQGAIHYTEGAARYAVNTPTSMLVWNGGTVGGLVWQDATFSGTATAPGTFDLTTAWSVFGSYEHFWTPSLRTSLYGSYLSISRNANGNRVVCDGLGWTQAGCNMDGSSWNIGSRSQWDVIKGLYIGIDVMYSKLNSDDRAGGLTQPVVVVGGGAKSTTLYRIEDQDAVSLTWRIHRDIVP